MNKSGKWSPAAAGAARRMTAPERAATACALMGALLATATAAQAQVPANAYSYSRVTSYTYYAESDGAAKRGRLKTETVEPDQAQLGTVSTYDYVGGNRTSAKTANLSGATGKAVFTARSASSAYAAVASQPVRVGTTSVNVAVPAGLFASTLTTDPSGLAYSETRSTDPRFGTLLTLTGPNGLATSWQVDDFGRQTKELRPDGTSTVTAYCVLTGLGLDTSANSKTANGDPLDCPTPPAGQAPADAVMFTHSVTLNTSATAMSGYVRVFKDRLGRDLRVVTESFDGTGQASGKAGVAVYTDAVYNPYGVKELQTQPYFAATGSSTTGGANDVGVAKTEVDALGRSIAIHVADAQGAGGSLAMGAYGSRTVAVTRFSYSGMKLVTTNDKGQKRTEEKNALGELVRVTDATGATLVHQRDAFGNLAKTRDALGNTTTIVHDIRGRKTQLQDPDKGTWNYAYDALGQQVWQQSPKQLAAGTQTTMAYDVLGRMTSRTEPEYTSTWQYDKNTDGTSCMGANAAQGKGKLCQSSTTHGVSRKYVYDGFGRPTSRRTDVTSGPSLAEAWAYDASTGRLASQTYPTGVKVNHAYTGRGYPEKLTLATAATVTPLPNAQGVKAANGTLPAGSLLWQAKVVGAWGRAEQQAFGNGVTGRAAYEAATGRVKDLTAGTNNAVLAQHYTWDSLSNLVARVDDNGDGSTGAISEAFGYDDGLNRLTSYEVSAPAIPGTSRTVTLQYNALGLLLYKSDVGNYSYNAQAGAAGSKPHAVQSVSGAHTASYGYDAHGNVTSATAGKYRSISYTSFDLPDGGTGLQGPSGSPKYTWQYDENHARIKETRVNAAGTRTTWYLHPDNAGGLAFESETAPGNLYSQRHYLSVGGASIGVLVSTGALPTLTAAQTAPTALSSITLVKVEYWHKDQQGSLASTTDHTGAVTARYAYDPFGKRRYTNGNYDAQGNVTSDFSPSLNAGTDRGYTGHEHLDDAGVVHMNGRLFDPLLGRFMQAASAIGDAADLQDFDRYTYCANNPLSCTDPSGLRAIRPQASATAIVAMMREGAMVQLGSFIATASTDYAFNTTPRPIALPRIGLATSGAVDPEAYVNANRDYFVAIGLDPSKIIADIRLSREAAFVNMMSGSEAMAFAEASVTGDIAQLNMLGAAAYQRMWAEQSLREAVQNVTRELLSKVDAANLSGSAAFGQSEQFQLLNQVASVVSNFVNGMQDACSECSQNSFLAMTLSVSPLSAEQAGYTSGVLASYDAQTNTATFYQDFFKTNVVTMASTVFHEYLHSLPSNQELVRNATPAQWQLPHASRPWEAAVLRVETIFQQRYGQDIWRKFRNP